MAPSGSCTRPGTRTIIRHRSDRQIRLSLSHVMASVGLPSKAAAADAAFGFSIALPRVSPRDITHV